VEKYAQKRRTLSVTPYFKIGKLRHGCEFSTQAQDMSSLTPELFEEKYNLNKKRIEKRNVDNSIFGISMYTSYTFLVKSYVSSDI
jgi:predicted small metal-binding protein